MSIMSTTQPIAQINLLLVVDRAYERNPEMGLSRQSPNANKASAPSRQGLGQYQRRHYTCAMTTSRRRHLRATVFTTVFFCHWAVTNAPSMQGPYRVGDDVKRSEIALYVSVNHNRDGEHQIEATEIETTATATASLSDWNRPTYI